MSRSVKNNDYSTLVHDRRSIRLYDKDVKISREEITDLLAEATRAPSALNLQPWRFVVVDSEEGKNKLEPFVSFNMRQHTSSSAMIVIFGDMNPHSRAEEIYSQAVDEGKMDVSVKDAQIEQITSIYDSFSEERMKQAVALDVGLVGMQVMLGARSRGYDTCPITGFTREGLAEAFDLDASRYHAVMMISIGQAIEPGFDTVRFDIDDITTFE